jgi:hypothetical protein
MARQQYFSDALSRTWYFAMEYYSPLTAFANTHEADQEKNTREGGRLIVSEGVRKVSITLTVVFIFTHLPKAFFFQLKIKKGTDVSRSGWQAKGRKCKWAFEGW